MPKVDFQNGLTSEVKVSGKRITDTPPAGVPVGPQGFPPPPPPPPPPPALVISSILASIGDDFCFLNFDRAPAVAFVPGWTFTGSDAPVINMASFNDTEQVQLQLSKALSGDEVLHITGGTFDAVAVNDGGTVAAGAYPLF